MAEKPCQQQAWVTKIRRLCRVIERRIAGWPIRRRLEPMTGQRRSRGYDNSWMWSALGKELQERADGIFRILARNERAIRQAVEELGSKMRRGCTRIFNSKEDNPGELVIAFENFRWFSAIPQSPNCLRRTSDFPRRILAPVPSRRRAG